MFISPMRLPEIRLDICTPIGVKAPGRNTQLAINISGRSRVPPYWTNVEHGVNY